MSDSSDSEALFVISIAFGVYLLTGGVVFFLLTGGLKKGGSAEETLPKKLVGLPFLPTFVFWLVVLACISIPYWWLFPEKHMTIFDFGTEAEKERLQQYRAECAKRGLLCRLGGKLRILQSHRPDWPFSKEEEEAILSRDPPEI